MGVVSGILARQQPSLARIRIKPGVATRERCSPEERVSGSGTGCTGVTRIYVAGSSYRTPFDHSRPMHFEVVTQLSKELLTQFVASAPWSAPRIAGLTGFERD